MSVSTISHAHTVVWECCKDDQQSQWEMLKFDPQLPLNPLSDRHQIWHAWLRHGYLSPRKNWAQSAKGFLPPICAKYTPPCSLPCTHVYYFFWFFQSPTAETPAWILTLKTSNGDVLLSYSAFFIFAVLVVWFSHSRPYLMFLTVKFFYTYRHSGKCR